MQQLRGTAVTMATVAQAQIGQVSSVATQPMTIRPVFLNRPVTIAGTDYVLYRIK
jgi:hypothetical protein